MRVRTAGSIGVAIIVALATHADCEAGRTRDAAKFDVRCSLLIFRLPLDPFSLPISVLCQVDDDGSPIPDTDPLPLLPPNQSLTPLPVDSDSIPRDPRERRTRRAIPRDAVAPHDPPGTVIPTDGT